MKNGRDLYVTAATDKPFHHVASITADEAYAGDAIEGAFLVVRVREPSGKRGMGTVVVMENSTSRAMRAEEARRAAGALLRWADDEEREGHQSANWRAR